MAIVLTVLGEAVGVVKSFAALGGDARRERRARGSGWAARSVLPAAWTALRRMGPTASPAAHSASLSEEAAAERSREPALPFHVSFQKTWNPSPGSSVPIIAALPYIKLCAGQSASLVCRTEC